MLSFALLQERLLCQAKQAPAGAEDYDRTESMLASASMIPPLQPSRSDPSSGTSAVVADDRAVVYLIDTLIARSGLSQSEIARRLGIRLQSLHQYRRRRRPGLIWFAKLASACGAELNVKFPK